MTKTTNEQILQKAIEKAVKNGYRIRPDLLVILDEDVCFDIIFSHDFAKAFWGEEMLLKFNTEHPVAWQYHLQQMVLCDAPISYLKKFI